MNDNYNHSSNWSIQDEIAYLETRIYELETKLESTTCQEIMDLDTVMSIDSELSNLYRHYRNLICDYEYE